MDDKAIMQQAGEQNDCWTAKENEIDEQERNEEKDANVQLLRRKLDLLVRTGCILMASNADCPRIMRNMERCEAYLGL